MGKALVLAEKPSVARDIARVMHATQKMPGYIEGKTMIVTWALGHLVQLAGPDRYDAKYKTWRLEDLPILPNQTKLEIIPESRKQYETVRKLCQRADVTSIIIATDAGREGELVARWAIEMAKCKKPIKRLWISSVTDKAIKEGFNQLKDGRHYVPLFHSAIARAQADWFVGINATRALTTKYNAQLSCGRVQTPSIALIRAREEQINRFQPAPYVELSVKAENVTFLYQNAQNQSRIFDLAQADTIERQVNGQALIIKDIKKQMKRHTAPTLYDLTELQRDANRRYNYSAKETLSIAQSLYERHKVLTYPRTDSKYLSRDIVPTLKERLMACNIGDFKPHIQPLLRQMPRGPFSFVNDAKVSDHHAIIPTEEPADWFDLNDSEKKIYELVVKRFIAALYPPYIYEQTTLLGDIQNHSFTAKGKIVKDLGWKAVFEHRDIDDDEDQEEHDQSLPDIHKGQKFIVSNVIKQQKMTKPPAYLNEGTLLAAMENPTKYMNVSDQNLKQTLEDTGGLGTVATRADVIEKLFAMHYIELRGKDIITTSKGRQVLALAPEELRSPLLTARWEQQLQAIAKSKLDKDKFIADIRQYAHKVVTAIAKSTAEYKHDNLSSKPCPECGKPLLTVKNKDTQMLKCQDRECGYKSVVSRKTQARCPVCHKRLELFGEGDQAMFTCLCGHRERMSTFEARKKEDSQKMSKKDASRVVQKINKEADQVKNNAMAQALKDLLK